MNTLIVRKGNRAAKLSYPSDGNYRPIQVAKAEDLHDYSISANDVQSDELMYVYFLALDEDDTPIDTDIILDVTLESLQLLIEQGSRLPYGDFVGFFASWFAGNYAAWWEQADVIGLYRIDLSPRNNWLRDKSFEETSFDGNMRIRFSVIGGNLGQDPVTPIPPDAIATPSFPGIAHDIEVTRVIEIEVTRVIQVIVTRVVEVMADSNDPAETLIKLITPANSEYKSPLTFSWQTQPSVIPPYRVVMWHSEKGFSRVSPWIGATKWTTEIPKEQFGNWEWYVESRNGERSNRVVFVFNPHPNSSGK